MTLAGLLAAPGVASAQPDELTDPPDAVPIIGGVEAGEDELDAVVLLTTNYGSCSGTLIAPRVVLTAAHCFDDLDEDATVTVGFGPRGTKDSMVAEGFGIHPQYCVLCQEEAYDFAYVELPRDYEPAGGYLHPLTDPREWDETMRIGNVVLLAGYGTDDPHQQMAASPLKRKVTTTISEFSDNGIEFYAGGQQRDTCSGDSGGAAVVPLGRGGYRLAGVTSRGSNPCGAGGWYGVPYSALLWVQTLTGAQLLPPGCENGGCLELEPATDEEAGCRVGERPEFGGWAFALLVTLAIRRRD
ncbi:MAG: trypsin-like serine protease [Myxococcota bacterium]